MDKGDNPVTHVAHNDNPGSHLHAELQPHLDYNMHFNNGRPSAADHSANGHLPSLDLSAAQVKEARTIENDVMNSNVTGLQQELAKFHNNVKGFGSIAAQVEYDLHGRGVEMLNAGSGSGDSHGNHQEDVSISLFGAKGGPMETITSQPNDGILMGKINLKHGEDADINYVGGSGNAKHVLSDIAAGKHS